MSRRHARLASEGDQWLLTDLESRHGTRLNGISLTSHVPTPLEAGDRISIGPWTLALVSDEVAATSIASIDDAPSRNTSVARVSDHELGTLAERRLSLLMEAARVIQEGDDEESVARCAAHALVAGTGFGRALLVRQFNGVEELEVLASHAPNRSTPALSQRAELSRTLLRAASHGVVRLDQSAAIQDAQSIVSQHVANAICAPVRVGDQIDAFIYVDSSEGEGRTQPDAAAFCSAIANLVALALANLRRSALELRHRLLMKDLSVAHDVQRRLMPPDSGRTGHIAYHLHTQPGRFVAGDFFGILTVSDSRVAVFVGDVTGKGLGASILMASIQARLTAALEQGDSAHEATSAVNRYVAEHSAENEFASLWLAVLDCTRKTIECTDAGHGYAALIPSAGSPPQRIRADGGLPIGIDPNQQYESTEIGIEPGARLLIFSDGVPEQRSEQGDELGFDRILEALRESTSPEADVQAVLGRLIEHAGASEFADDVTVASMQIVE